MTTKPEQPPLSIEERIQQAARQIAMWAFDELPINPAQEILLAEGCKAILRRHFGDLGGAPAESQPRIAASKHNPDFCLECDDINRCASAETCYAHHPGFPKAHVTTPSDPPLRVSIPEGHTFSNVSINGAKVGDPLCLDCGRDKSAIKHRESGGHPFIATERRSGSGERRVKDLGCICARGDGRLGTNCQPQDKLSRRTGPPDRRKAQPGQER